MAEFNGWSSYQTWCVNRWLNKEPSYLWLTQLANNPELSGDQKCEVVKNEVEDAIPLIESEVVPFTLDCDARNCLPYDGRK